MTPRRTLGFSERDKGGVFFLHGEDRFRMEEEAQRLVDRHLEEETRVFNFDSLRGSEVRLEDLASILATPPMMAPWRVVLLREVEAMGSSPRARKLLLETAQKPPPGLVLILLAIVPRSRSGKWYSELRRSARSAEFPEIPEHDVPGWLVEWAVDRLGRTLAFDAAQALTASVGPNLGMLTQEVRKLATLVGEGEAIGVDAVLAAGTRVPRANRWRWFDRVGRRQFESAWRDLGDLFDQGESAVGLVIGLTSHLLRVGLARAGGYQAVAEALPQYQKRYASSYVQQAKQWPMAELQEALLGLRKADHLLKSSGLPERLILEEWLLGLMRPGAGGAAAKDGPR